MTTKQAILALLANNQPHYKGNVEEAIRQTEKRPMGDTTARRLRELVNDGKILKLKDTNGNTMYRLPEPKQDTLFVLPVIKNRAY